VLKQGLVDLSQALENGSIGGDMFMQPNKARTMKTLMWITRSLWRILAAMTASV